MTEFQALHQEAGEAPNIEGVSLRSRASSIISTGTKFSISTMPQGNIHIDGVIEGSNVRVSTRPASIYSIRSMAPSLPPYEESQIFEASTPATSHTGGLHPLQNVSTAAHDPDLPPTPSTTDAENANALSQHYGRIVRTIDENHSRQLSRTYQAHAQELAATRNAIDQAYRTELRAKDREVERIREEAAANVASLEAEIKSLSVAHDEAAMRMQQEAADEVVALHKKYQAAIHKARNAIEDVWEARWNDRTSLAAEEANRRAFEDQQRLQKAMADRDEEWLRLLESFHPELVNGMKPAMEAFQATKK